MQSAPHCKPCARQLGLKCAVFVRHPEAASLSEAVIFHFSCVISMSFEKVTPGKNAPETFNVVIEIAANSDPVKYEVDKETGCVFVDRFMGTAMHYPCNYGYVPQTLAGDGDPVDVLVLTPFPLPSGVVVPCRPLGILKMEDEAGGDSKLVAVPTEKVCAMYKGKQFRIRPVEEILEDIDMARDYYGPGLRRVFLMDGDAVIMKTVTAKTNIASLEFIGKCLHLTGQFGQLL